MKQFIHLSPKESIGLDISIYRNAIQLKKDAILVANKRKSYSSASSLLILSTEETIKSILVKLHSEKYSIYKLKESSKFFRDHKIRHQIAQLIELGSGFIESIVKFENRTPTTLVKTKSNWLNGLTNGIIDLMKAIKPFLSSTERIKSLQEFNDLKNGGFYVDFKDEVLLPQEKVTKEDYLKTLMINDRISIFYKGLRILFHEKLENHIPKEEIIETQQILKEIIEKSIKDISFKELNKIKL